MGNLKPGGTYIYERVDNTVFRREAGQVERPGKRTPKLQPILLAA